MATRILAKLHGDRLTLVFYPAGDSLNGVNASVCLTQEETRELLQAIEEALPEEAAPVDEVEGQERGKAEHAPNSPSPSLV